MKTEQGIVIEASDNVAKIKVGRHNDCSNCGACPGNDSVIISANNKIGAIVGQRVVFDVKEVNVLRGAFVVFILPLIAIFVGVLVGGEIGRYIGADTHIFQIAGGIITFLLSIIFVKLFDKAATASEKSKPEIIRIL
ncbi:SoxR reducing system protein RseC [Clostridium puniceum]|uniref:SoxR reducing system protein RseC n=1 Tax=Clostridium puniceum TaxID=29367 RepID=A0A1S8TX32_9CLOT|nr:SoxR reducing system RseC family protein [Clostridium puniceum]OOM82240.1 SoxR reducing system protein RseC [Clostridium puniceum]